MDRSADSLATILNDIQRDLEELKSTQIRSESTLPDNSVTTDKIADGAVTTNKVENNAITTNKIANANITSEKLGAFESVPATDYINITVGTVNSAVALKFGKLVVISLDISGCNPIAGEKVIGSCTSKVRQTVYGSARVTGGSRMGSASYVAIPSGQFRIYADQAGTGTTGSIWLVEA